jgi:hypothetical protein
MDRETSLSFLKDDSRWKMGYMASNWIIGDLQGLISHINALFWYSILVFALRVLPAHKRQCPLSGGSMIMHK